MAAKKLFAAFPLTANALTAAFLYGSGDILAQNTFPSVHQSTLDYARMARAMTYGAFVAAPIGFTWYRFLGKRNFASGWKDLIVKVALDQLVYAPLVAVPAYFTCMKYLEQRPELVYERLRDKYWETVKSTWALWPPFQVFNFLVVPPQYRLLAVNCFRLGWNCVLSVINARS